MHVKSRVGSIVILHESIRSTLAQNIKESGIFTQQPGFVIWADDKTPQR